MPTLNSDKYIKTALDSIIKQTFASWELIIVDDNSLDNTIEYVESYNDKRIIIIKNNEKIGISKSRNIGILNSRGKYICVHDSDDFSDKNRLLLQYNCFINYNYKIIGSNGIRIYDGLTDYTDIKEVVTHDDLINKNIVIHGSLMFEKDVLIEEGLYNPAFKYCEDYELILRLTKKGYNIKILKEKLYYYRIHETNISTIKYENLNLYSTLVNEVYLYKNINIQDIDIDNNDVYNLLSNKGKTNYHRKLVEKYRHNRNIRKYITNIKYLLYHNPNNVIKILGDELLMMLRYLYNRFV